MTIDDALAGAAGLAGLQWVLYGAPMQAALQAAISGLLAPPATLSACRLLRAKAKPGRKLTAYYEATLAGVPTGVAATRALAVTWTLPFTPPLAATTAQITPLEAEALACGVAAPFQRLITSTPAWRMQLEVAPFDPAFPQLVRAMTPTHIAALLGAAADQPAYTATTIRYRPRQRHVLRYATVSSLSGASNAAPIFAKLCQADEGAATWAVVTWVAEQLAQSACSVAALCPQAWIAADQLLLYPYVAGVPLSELLSTNQPVAPLLHRSGVALRALHEAPVPSTLPLARKTFAGEIKATLQAGEHLVALAPQRFAALQALLEQLQARHQQLPTAAPVFTHSDFKADHLLVDNDQMTLIDFDSCALADPAADVGKFLADLRWWHVLGGGFDLPQAQAAFLTGYGLTAPSAPLARARLYESLILAKSTVRRLNRFDEQWLPQTQHLLTQAAQLL